MQGFNPIKRRNIFLKASDSEHDDGAQNLPLAGTKTAMPCDEEFKVLVVNASGDMAKEITLQLTLSLPGCSIMYAPTIELAKWIISRRRLDLVVSSPILPDGPITRLQGVLSRTKSPPGVVVVGAVGESNPKLFGNSGYEIAALKKLGSRGELAAFKKPQRGQPLAENIKNLGADLRNDLNNPLQEIVAMVFVAKAGGELPPGIRQALDAIDAAAGSMAQVVRGLEDKIKKAVHT